MLTFFSVIFPEAAIQRDKRLSKFETSLRPSLGRVDKMPACSHGYLQIIAR